MVKPIRWKRLEKGQKPSNKRIYKYHKRPYNTTFYDFFKDNKKILIEKVEKSYSPLLGISNFEILCSLTNRHYRSILRKFHCTNYNKLTKIIGDGKIGSNNVQKYLIKQFSFKEMKAYIYMLNKEAKADKEHEKEMKRLAKEFKKKDKEQKIPLR